MRITKKGQVTIPHRLREELGFLPDTEVELEKSDGCIVIRLAVASESASDDELNGKMRARVVGRNLTTRAPAKSEKRRSRTTAVEYVTRMGLSDELVRPMEDAAKRFQDKAFLPTMGDVRHFCVVHGIAPPPSGSRESAIPRVFQFLSSRAPDAIESILNGGMFSGPARLGPIADAIREAGKNRIRRTPSGSDDYPPSENGGMFSGPARLDQTVDDLRETDQIRAGCPSFDTPAPSHESRLMDEDISQRNPAP